MIVQIYEISTPEDARMMLDLDVDHIGMVVTEAAERQPGWVAVKDAREIIELVDGRTVISCIVPTNDFEEIVQTAAAVQPDILHLSMDPRTFSPALVHKVRDRLPGMKIMQAVPVGGPESRDLALQVVRDYDASADFFIIDTKLDFDDPSGIGATGVVNDWGIGREIVEMTSVPVILAGGLSPDNVADAVRAVRPWGVDSMTCTNVDGSRSRKDRDKVLRFVREARSATL
jgi:phosphoribosylanthranilate isomerase